MAKTVEDDIERINTIIKNIDFCCEYSKKFSGIDFQNDIAVQYALCMGLQIICENANHITNETKEIAKDIPWKDIIKTRNIISHEYGALNLSMVFDTIKNDLPMLKNQLNSVLEVLNDNKKM